MGREEAPTDLAFLLLRTSELRRRGIFFVLMLSLGKQQSSEVERAGFLSQVGLAAGDGNQVLSQ